MKNILQITENYYLPQIYASLHRFFPSQNSEEAFSCPPMGRQGSKFWAVSTPITIFDVWGSYPFMLRNGLSKYRTGGHVRVEKCPALEESSAK